MKRFLALIAVIVALVASIAQAADYSVTTEIMYDKNFPNASATNRAYTKDAAGLVSVTQINNAFSVATGTNLCYLLVVDSLQAADTTGAIPFAMQAPNRHGLGDAYYIPTTVTVATKVTSWRPMSTLGSFKPAATAGISYKYAIAMQVADDPSGPWRTGDAAILDSSTSSTTLADSVVADLTRSASWLGHAETTTLTIGNPKYCRFIISKVAVGNVHAENHKVWIQRLWFTRKYAFTD